MLSEAAFHDFDYLTLDLDTKNGAHFTFFSKSHKPFRHKGVVFFFLPLRWSCCFLQIAARPGSQHFKCLYRVAFVPRDAYDLLTADPNAYEYFYMQVSTRNYAN